MNFEQVKPFIESECSQEFHKDGIHLIGFPFDGTSSYRAGSRFGPNALREASENLETYSPYLNKDLEDHKVYDLGNINFSPSRFDLMTKEFNDALMPVKLKEDHIRLITLGGEHSISFGPILKHLKEYPDMVILQLDAHADLRESYLDNPHSHACIMRRVLENMSESSQLIQYGIRSGTREEFQWMHEHNTRANSIEELIIRLKNIDEARPVYLTLDLDYFDPAFFPGTGTPEAGGEDFNSFIKLIKVLATKNLVGADVVELAPNIDPTGNSSCFASKVVREIILALS
ncbi:MAG: agmatinase [Thermoproteota archaeon]|jgi:agmatinase